MLRDNEYARIENRATDKRQVKIMVKCLLQLHQCTTRQEYHVGDVIFELQKAYIKWNFTTDNP